MMGLLHIALLIIAAPPTATIDFTVERPPTGSYGVIASPELSAPISLTLKMISGPELRCDESNSKVSCTFPSGWYAGVGQYVLSADVSAPSEGEWRQVFSLPDEVTDLSLVGTVSLRYGTAGLHISSGRILAKGTRVLALSNRLISSTLPRDVIRADASFSLTNVGDVPLVLPSVGSSPYGSLWKRTDGNLERVRDGDMCGDIWSHYFELPLPPGKTLALTDPIVSKSLPPGEYEYIVIGEVSTTGSIKTIYQAAYSFKRE